LRARWSPRRSCRFGRHLPTHGGLFVGLLVGVILIIAAWSIPGVALGPIVEHLVMQAGTVF